MSCGDVMISSAFPINEEYIFCPDIFGGEEEEKEEKEEGGGEGRGRDEGEGEDEDDGRAGMVNLCCDDWP